MRLTRVGGPTVLVEFDGWRVLVDPTFDPPGRRYSFGWGSSSRKTIGPAIQPAALGRIDLVLITHDQHADNLDDAGRALLPEAGIVVSTASGAVRLALPQVVGLAAGERAIVSPATRHLPPLEITATPCRHGFPLSRAVVGEVVGFAIRRPGQSAVSLWVTGDTVLCPAVRRTAAELDVDVAIINAGGVRFPLTGPLRYTMDGKEAVELIGLAKPRVAALAHYDGWSHFRDGDAGLRTALAAAPEDVRGRALWLTDGVPMEV
jgi:L-ascorbate metabolism protein UlaG (beta-lactamase superfamily)